MNQTALIDLQIVPKSRPRFCKQTGNVYNPKNYVENQRDLKNLLVLKLEEVTEYPIQMEIVFTGTYSSCDLDNLCGAIMDGLQKAFIIKNDNTRHINQLVLSHKLSDVHQVAISLTKL